MADVLTKAQRSYCMSKIKGKNTKPETSLRKSLWALGYRYRINSNVYGKPDIVYISKKVAIFVDGCFWHKCPTHFVEPKTRNEYWKKKILKNVERDKEVNNRLKEDGWTVLRFWEHEVQDDIERCLNKVIEFIK